MPATKPTIDFSLLENSLRERGFSSICGVDEVGRGPLAGPVVAAAAVIPPGVELPGLRDSKQLSPAQRDTLFEQMAQSGVHCAIGIIEHGDIDQYNILRASLMAMRKAVGQLTVKPDVVLVDGNQPIPNLNQQQFTLVGGDRTSPAIMAASIIAKVTRDRIMDRYAEIYPEFNFARHKGYCTKDHLEELRRHGPCEIHRRSFKPVAELIEQYALL